MSHSTLNTVGNSITFKPIYLMGENVPGDINKGHRLDELFYGQSFEFHNCYSFILYNVYKQTQLNKRYINSTDECRRRWRKCFLSFRQTDSHR